MSSKFVGIPSQSSTVLDNEQRNLLLKNLAAESDGEDDEDVGTVAADLGDILLEDGRTPAAASYPASGARGSASRGSKNSKYQSGSNEKGPNSNNNNNNNNNNRPSGGHRRRLNFMQDISTAGYIPITIPTEYMTVAEIEQQMRIQAAGLFSVKPRIDDFYYQVHVGRQRKLHAAEREEAARIEAERNLERAREAKLARAAPVASPPQAKRGNAPQSAAAAGTPPKNMPMSFASIAAQGITPKRQEPVAAPAAPAAEELPPAPEPVYTPTVMRALARKRRFQFREADTSKERAKAEVRKSVLSETSRGALGALILHSSKAPKQLLQLADDGGDVADSSDAVTQGRELSDATKRDALSVERAFLHVLDVEDLDERYEIAEELGEGDDYDRIAELEMERDVAGAALFISLGVHVMPTTEDGVSLTRKEVLAKDAPFFRTTLTRKGRKLVARSLALLPPAEVFHVALHFLRNLGQWIRESEHDHAFSEILEHVQQILVHSSPEDMVLALQVFVSFHNKSESVETVLTSPFGATIVAALLRQAAEHALLSHDTWPALVDLFLTKAVKCAAQLPGALEPALFWNLAVAFVFNCQTEKQAKKLADAFAPALQEHEGEFSAEKSFVASRLQIR